MPEWMLLLIAGVGALAVIWIALVLVLWRQQRRLGGSVDWREVARLVPDVVRLVRQLAVDPDGLLRLTAPSAHPRSGLRDGRSR